MKKIKQKKRIKWPRTRLERYQQYGDMGSTERLRFSQTVSNFLVTQGKIPKLTLWPTFCHL